MNFNHTSKSFIMHFYGVILSYILVMEPNYLHSLQAFAFRLTFSLESNDASSTPPPPFFLYKIYVFTSKLT